MNFFRFAALINRPRNVELLKKILSMPHPKFCGVPVKADPLYEQGYKTGKIVGVGSCVRILEQQKAQCNRMSEIMAIDHCIAAIKARCDK